MRGDRTLAVIDCFETIRHAFPPASVLKRPPGYSDGRRSHLEGRGFLDLVDLDSGVPGPLLREVVQNVMYERAKSVAAVVMARTKALADRCLNEDAAWPTSSLRFEDEGCAVCLVPTTQWNRMAVLVTRARGGEPDAAYLAWTDTDRAGELRALGMKILPEDGDLAAAMVDDFAQNGNEDGDRRMIYRSSTNMLGTSEEMMTGGLLMEAYGAVSLVSETVQAGPDLSAALVRGPLMRGAPVAEDALAP